MNVPIFVKNYGVSIAATAALCAGIWWGADEIVAWHTNAQANYSEMHEFLHQSDDIPFQDGKLSDAQIAARDNNVTAIKGPKDAIDWKILSKAQLNFTLKNGEQIPSPVFTKQIFALNNLNLKAKGYIYPLDQTGKQKHFLLSPYPPSCPYCLPAGPSELIEVTMKSPITFTYDAILIQGDFETIQDDRIKQGMLFGMKNAELIN